MAVPNDTRSGTDELPSALHSLAPPGSSWSSINLAEAVPGVMTPLCASVWSPASELGLRAPFHAMGALPSRDRGMPADPADRIATVFFGRMAVRVDFLCRIGDLIPGQSGEALSRDVFGFVPPDFVSRPSLRRLPVIIARYPRTLLRIAARVGKLRAGTNRWWHTEIPRVPNLSLRAAQRLLADAVVRFAENLTAQAVITACAIQPVYEQVTKMASAAGVDPAVLMRGQGSHEETAVIDDLWALSRSRIDLPTFLERHGYHGPEEGEVSSVAWREDPTPIARLVERYRGMGEDAAPEVAERRRVDEREQAEQRLLAATSGAGQLTARLLLKLARRFVPLRGVGKVSYLQSLDMVRATARRIGELLVDQGLLADREDAFYLTDVELTSEDQGAPDRDLRELVAERRTLRARYQALEVPASWTGRPVPIPIADRPQSESGTLTGIGVSPGVVEGRAVVVHDPGAAEIEPGEILVAHTTDPAWASLMFLSGGLVVDIGGMLSHAAVVARELDIPCVMNTLTGTRVLRTGDLCRVDGSTGTVEIIEKNGGTGK